MDSIKQLAACYINLKKYQEAENLLTQYVGKSEHSELRYYLGLIYALLNKYDNAIDELKIVLSTNSQNEAARDLMFFLSINKATEVLKNNDHSSLTNLL